MKIAEAYVPLWTGEHPDTGDKLEHYAYYGGRGGGKSHGVGEACIGLTCRSKERVVCGRQYQNSIKDSVKELLEQKIHSMGMAVYFKSTEREIINVATGSRFSFIGMDKNPESAKSLEGATLFWGEEAQTFTLHSVELIIPTIRAAGSRMVWTWNPRFRTDAVDEMFRGPVPPEASYIRHVGVDDNPYFYQTRMPSEFNRSKRASPNRHNHIWLGGYNENPDVIVFSNWEVGHAIIPEKCIPRFGFDFGFSSDPNFIVKLYVIEELDLIYITNESCGYHIPNRNLPPLLDVIPEIRNYPIIADSARPETIEYVQSKQFNIYGARKGPGSVKNGINFLLGYKLMIHPDCPLIAEEIRNYRWAVDPLGKPLPMPANHQQDHGLDAMRYAVEDLTTNGGEGDDVSYI